MGALGEPWGRSLKPSCSSGNRKEAAESSVKLTVVPYTAAIAVCERAGQWLRGLQILERMHTAVVRADVVVYNSAINACGNAGRWESCVCLLMKLRDQALQCNVITCNSIISACEQSGHWTAAVRFFEELLSLHLQADTISYNSIVTALAAAQQWEAAMRMQLVWKIMLPLQVGQKQLFKRRPRLEVVSSSCIASTQAR